MGTLVDDDLTAPDVAVKESENVVEAVSEELVVSTPAWISELANRWKKHHHNDLRLRFETGAEINRKLGPTNVRQPRGFEVVRTLSIELGLDTTEISRGRRFAELAPSYPQFQSQHPECKTWLKVKSLLAGKVVSKSSDDDEQTPEVRGLIVRIRNATTAVKKNKVVVSGSDKTELLLELQKLAKALVKRAGVKLTVDLHEAAVA